MPTARPRSELPWSRMSWCPPWAGAGCPPVWSTVARAGSPSGTPDSRHACSGVSGRPDPRLRRARCNRSMHNERVAVMNARMAEKSDPLAIRDDVEHDERLGATLPGARRLLAEALGTFALTGVAATAGVMGAVTGNDIQTLSKAVAPGLLVMLLAVVSTSRIHGPPGDPKSEDAAT